MKIPRGIFSLCLAALVLPSRDVDATGRQDENSDTYRSFLRDVAARGERRLEDDLTYGCDAGCETNEDCEYPRICYIRKSGDLLPTCCTQSVDAYNESQSDNFCVSASCAAHTNDPNNPFPLLEVDDDYFIGGPFPKMTNCQTGCEGTYECAYGLICYFREKGDPLPGNCTKLAKQTKADKSKENVCIPPEWKPETPDTGGFNLDNVVAGFTGGGGNATGGATTCFSGENIVTVMDKGQVPIKELQVGDKVLVGGRKNGHQYSFQTVYAFAHLDEITKAPYLLIYTNRTLAAPTPLEVTAEHLVYVKGQGPVRADSIKEGDYLEGYDMNGPIVVTLIRREFKAGLYAPLTADGTIVVGGILASSYAAPQISTTSSFVELPQPIGVLPFLSQETVAHWWFSPLRLICDPIGDGTGDNNFGFLLPNKLCHRHNREGKLYWTDWGLRLVHFMEQQWRLAQVVVLTLAMVFLGIPMAAEQVLSFVGGWVPMLIMSSLVVILPRLRTRHQLESKARATRSGSQEMCV